jgi:uncharacterized coiled-coil DUF342 family protein
MNMQELNKEISELRKNLNGLIDTITELRKNELHLKQQIGGLKSEYENAQEKLKFLEEKNKMVNLASAVDPKEKEEMKLKIRELVREIDGCIAMIKS